MKKISLILAIAGAVWVFQPVQAQTTDTSKNKVEIKKKVRKGAHGRTVTKIKMTGRGTEATLHDPADGVVTGKLPTPAPVIVTPPPPPPPPEKVNTEPTVIVVTPEPEKKPDPEPEKKVEPTTTTVTTTSETKPVPVASTARTTTSHIVHRGTNGTKHVYHHVYTKKPAAATTTKTTTTTTIKKGE